MNGLPCDAVRLAAFDPRDDAGEWASRPGVAAHLRSCAECRAWREAFDAGSRAWVDEPAGALARAVLARTALQDLVVRDLPALAEMDPGPGFAERVLRATSLRPAAAGWRERLALSWWTLVRRPRFAWEAAYVATVCWVLVFGNPVGAIERGAATVASAAQERLGGRVRALQSDLDAWRAQWAPAPAGPAGAGAAAPQPEPPILRAWRAASAQVQRVSELVFDAVGRAWTSVSAWISALVDDRPPAPTEPEPSPVRSAH